MCNLFADKNNYTTTWFIYFMKQTFQLFSNKIINILKKINCNKIYFYYNTLFYTFA